MGAFGGCSEPESADSDFGVAWIFSIEAATDIVRQRCYRRYALVVHVGRQSHRDEGDRIDY